MANHAIKCAGLPVHAHTAGLGASFSPGQTAEKAGQGSREALPFLPAPPLLAHPPRLFQHK